MESNSKEEPAEQLYKNIMNSAIKVGEINSKLELAKIKFSVSKIIFPSNYHAIIGDRSGRMNMGIKENGLEIEFHSKMEDRNIYFQITEK